MKKVWKYSLHLRCLDKDSRVQFALPVGARIIHGEAAANPEYILFWYEFPTLVDEEEPRAMEHTLYVFGTGHPIPDHLKYLLTIVGPSFVWHLYQPPRD